MRLTTVILIATLMQVTAAGMAQRITMQQNNVTLKAVFTQIQLQTGYDVVIESAQLKKTKAIKVNFKNAELAAVLDELLPAQNLTYTIADKTIIVKPEAPSFLERLASVISNDRRNLIDVTGRVVDEKGNPLPGASVKVKGKNRVTTTNNNGEFVLKGVDEDAVLEISYIGYVMQEVRAQKNIGKVSLKMTSSDLQEVEINKGYYTTTKELNTGNVSSVTARDIERQPVGDPVLALQGRVPGLFIQQKDGTPGREVTIRLRGQNSLANGNAPLFIVDGIQFISNSPTITGSAGISTTPIGGSVSPFSFLNPNDIESIQVLKDADATAIYGSRGANGVVLISTKRGQSTKLKLDLNIYTGTSTSPQRVSFLETKQYLEMRREAFAADGKVPALGDYDLNGIWDTTSYTNWQDIFIGNAANLTESSLSLSGGNSLTNFRLGTTFRKEGVIYPGDNSTDKTNFQFSLNHLSSDGNFKLALSGVYSINKNNLPSARFTPTLYYRLAPNLPNPFNADGSLYWAPNNEWVNPMADLLESSNERANNLISNLHLRYRIGSHFELITSCGYTTTNFSQNNLTPFSSYNPSLINNAALLRVNQLLENYISSWVVEPQLSYKTRLLGGNIDFLVGSTFQNTEKSYLAIHARGFTSDAVVENFAAGTTITTRGRANSRYRYSALYSRIGYSLLDKYVINITARRDGSSRFGPENKFGNFGAIGGAWIFSKEPFFRNLSSVLSQGKIRASFGTTGNDQLPDYQYLDTYISNTNYYQGISSLVPNQLTNRYYGWEQVNKWEVGLELKFLNDRISLNASLYRNRTKNQLVQYGLPSVAGFTSVRANLRAVLQNSGTEIELQSNNISKKFFRWSTNFNLTIPKSKLVSYPNIEASSYANTYEVGKSLSLIRAFNYLGKDPTTQLYNFEDINKDGAITSAFDSKFYFRGQNFFGGIQNNIYYRGFELDFLFQFTKQNGNAYLKSPVAPGFFNSGNGNQPVHLLESDLKLPYSQSNTTISGSNILFNSSNGSLTDASFIRLKNISLSWQVPLKGKSDKILDGLRVYLQAQNLLTITNYQGFEPEAPTEGIAIPALRLLTFGLQITL